MAFALDERVMRSFSLCLRTCALLAALILTGCLIVPFPAEVDDVRGTAAVDAALELAPGEAIAVIGERGVEEDEGYPECVRNELEEMIEAMSFEARVISAAKFQKDFYPWFDPQRRPESIDALRAVITDSALMERIDSAGLRYLVYVRGGAPVEDLTGPALPHLGGGVASFDRAVGLVAEVWDLELGRSLGSVHVDASGEGGFVGFGFYGVWMTPLAEDAACTAMGQALAAVVAGARVEDVVEGLGEKRSERAVILRAKAADGNVEAATDLARNFGESDPLSALAGQGDVGAAAALARITNDLEPLKDLARGGDLEAARELGVYYSELGPLKAMAMGGNLAAARELARRFPDDSALWDVAVGGGPATAFAVYEIWSQADDRDGSKYRNAWRFLCMAANQDYWLAQSEVAYWHRGDIWEGLSTKRKSELRAVGAQSDNRIAYMWYTLAIILGDQYAVDIRRRIAKFMTKQEIAEAERMAGVWIPGDCPSADRRMKLPNDT